REDVEGRPQNGREEQRRFRRRYPASTEATPAFPLHVGHHRPPLIGAAHGRGTGKVLGAGAGRLVVQAPGDLPGQQSVAHKVEGDRAHWTLAALNPGSRPACTVMIPATITAASSTCS